MNIKQKIKACFLGIAFSSAIVPVASAEDIEIYTNLDNISTNNPHIMFLVDTSGSMGTKSWVKDSYDPSEVYTGSCVSTGVYFVADGKAPDCSVSEDYFDETVNVCGHSLVGYNAAGEIISPRQDGALLLVGQYSDQFAQFDTASNKWRLPAIQKTSDRNLAIECLSDSGIHGETDSSRKTYIENNASGGWTGSAPGDPDVPHAVWSNGAGNLTLFHGNFLNYLDDDSRPLVERSYLEQVQSAVDTMVRGNTRVNIGLMRFDRRAEGGSVVYPILDVGADRNDFFSRLATLDATGFTPLSEAYYESLLYLGGRVADYGESANPSNQVGAAESIGGGNKRYVSPISSTCDKSYVVVLSDGVPKRDYIDSDRRAVLPGFNVGSCNSDEETADSNDDNRDAFSSATSTVDNCLDELAGWAKENDIDSGSDNAVEGVQNVTTHTIGFQLDDLSAIQLMNDTAEAGGGEAHYAENERELIEIFNKIIASTLQVNTTFSSPAVSVNAFNRSTHLDDLYFTLFKPTEDAGWLGNLKKYKLAFDEVDGEKVAFVADSTGNDAIDPDSGFFDDNAMSYWSSQADGKEVSDGGAASNLSDSRNVYTFTGSYNTSGSAYVPSDGNLRATSNLLSVSNAAITDDMLGTTGFTEIFTDIPYRTTLLDWSKGLDVFSEYGVIDTTDDARLEVGDPLHAEPALVQYGLDAGNPDLVAYVATNDGYLHAFDVDDGKEIFSFVPQELLPNLSTAMEGVGAGGKLYGLDGNVVAWINDENEDGSINSGDGDHVYLYIGMRRGGNNIYSLDVTNRTSPVLRWVIKGGVAGGDYEELGQTWSTINVAKMKDGATERDVLIFGGGYDLSQDGATVRSADGIGRTVFVADALTGDLIWSAGKGGEEIAEMEYSIPARTTVLDVSGDGYIDRIYAADMGGQIFRFDINNTNGASLASSITGGRIADMAGSGTTDNRRFFYPPDVALADADDGAYHALVISSGNRAHPLNETVHDRIYMVKDRNLGLTTTYTTVTESDLKDVTDNLAGGDSGAEGDAAADAAREAELANIAAADGWYIDLEDEANPGSWIGEKGLAEALIIEGVAIVSTFTPDNSVSTDSCEPNVGIGKVFYLDLLDATPAFPNDVDKRNERHIVLKRGGIPSTPNIIITEDGIASCNGTECQTPEFGLGISKTYWYEVEK